jgi:hypothetical protein
LRASRRTATSEIVLAAILRDARRAKPRAELLRMRSVGFVSAATALVTDSLLFVRQQSEVSNSVGFGVLRDAPGGNA